MKMGITVEQLLQVPFSARCLERKIQIVLEGKPGSVFQASAVAVGDMKRNAIVQTHLFKPEIYDLVPWLTGCESESSFYCWPCLLFPSSDLNWKVTNPAFLSTSISEHEQTVKHIQAAFTLKMFCLEYIMRGKETMDDEEFNRMVVRNRKIVKLLIDAVSIAVTAVKPPLKQYACQSLIDVEICVKALKLLRICSIQCNSEIEDSINMIKTSPSLLNTMVAAMVNVLKIKIKKDIRNSTYASLILSDHSKGHTKSQMSAIVRYTEKGKVHERFLGFVNVLVRKSATTIYNIISNLVDKFGLSDKLLSYSLDGGVLEPSELHDLLSMMNKFHPQAFFVPCYFHGLYYILQQSLSGCKELREFFRMLSVMEAYVQQSVIQCRIRSTPCKLPSLEKSTLCSEALFLKVVGSCRRIYINCMDCIVNDNCDLWRGDDYNKARTILAFLQEFQTVFLFHSLAPLYDHMTCLDEDLKSSSLKIAFRSKTISAITEKLLSEKKIFEKHFYSAVKEMNKNVGNQQESTPLYYTAEKDFCRELHWNIIDHLIREITLRFKNLNKLKFCCVVNKSGYGVRKILNLMKCCPKMLKVLRPSFCEEQFKNEIEVQLKSKKILCESTAYELLDGFEDASLKDALKCTHRLVEFTLTLPFLPPVPDGDSSKFQNIKRFSFPSTSAIASDDVSVLHIERDVLQNLRTKMFFHDEVMEKLYDLDKSIELMYRR